MVGMDHDGLRGDIRVNTEVNFPAGPDGGTSLETRLRDRYRTCLLHPVRNQLLADERLLWLEFWIAISPEAPLKIYGIIEHFTSALDFVAGLFFAIKASAAET
jgi:hypothetical protein